MRTAKISIDGKSYLLCFSARVMRACTERYGAMENIDDALSGDTVAALDESIWILSQLMDAGARYAEMNGIENPKSLGFDGLYDAMSIDDLSGMKGKIAETITNGRSVTVEAEAPKNGEATPEKE